MRELTFIVPATSGGIRLDKWLSDQAPDLSRSRIQQLIAEGRLSLLGATLSDSSRKVKPGETYLLTVPEVEQLDLAPIAMPLDIIFEDEHLLVINKPAGLTVHPSDSSNEPTLVHGLLAHCGASLSGIGGIARPGIVHRIDKDTTGLLVVAKHDQAHQHLSAQLKSRTLSRHYMALCWGVPKPAHGTIQTFIGRSPRDRKKMAVLSCGGREAITHYTLEEKFRASETQEIVYFASRIGCKLETGRTHQIRVHLAHIGNPLIGDTLYGANGVRKMAGLEISDAIRTALTSFQRQALHAQSIRFIHPKTAEVMQFEAPLPTDLSTLINLLR